MSQPNRSRKKPITIRETLLLEKLISAHCDDCKKGQRALWDNHHKTFYHPEVYDGHPCSATVIRRLVGETFDRATARRLCLSRRPFHKAVLDKARKGYKRQIVQGVKVRARDIGGGLVAVYFDDLPKMHKARKVPLIST